LLWRPCMACPRTWSLRVKDPGLRGAAGKGVWWLRPLPHRATVLRISCGMSQSVTSEVLPVLPGVSPAVPAESPRHVLVADVLSQPLCRQLGSMAHLHPPHPPPVLPALEALLALVALSPKSLNLFFCNCTCRCCCGPSSFICKKLTSLRSTKIAGWTLHHVIPLAKTTGESVQTA